MSNLKPAEKLTGETLNETWLVVQKIELPRNHTGGHFSCGYKVRNTHNSKPAFLKALDYSSALKSRDPARVLQAMTTAYNYERDLLEKCKIHKMNKVVTTLDTGKIEIDEQAVEFLIFELANGDVRSIENFYKNFDVAVVLRTLHNIAIGIKQLHSADIAHQDIKPSNVLIFEGNEYKISDLGRASSKENPSPFDNIDIAGDKSYAPPELLYSHLDPDWSKRRKGCDIYHLGSMIVFFFTGLSMTVLLESKLPDNLKLKSLGNNYKEALPYIIELFNQSMEDFSNSVSEDYLRNELSNIVRHLCNPNPDERRSNLNNGTNSLGLEKLITRLDVLTRKAELEIFKQNY